MWYYSTLPQLRELLHSLDDERYERDLVQIIAEMREEIDRQMQLTEQLTKAVQAGRRSVIDVLNGTSDIFVQPVKYCGTLLGEQLYTSHTHSFPQESGAE